MPITTDDFFGPGIFGFVHEHRWLSNFQLVNFVLDDIEWRSTEHRYQAMKTLNPKIRKIISEIHTPSDAKLFASNKITLRSDWNTIQKNGLSFKDNVMLDVLRIKYDIEPYQTWLLETEGLYLEETNWWNDTYWGVCNGVGLNKLGKFTMRVRDEKLAGIV